MTLKRVEISLTNNILKMNVWIKYMIENIFFFVLVEIINSEKDWIQWPKMTWKVQIICSLLLITKYSHFQILWYSNPSLVYWSTLLTKLKNTTEQLELIKKKNCYTTTLSISFKMKFYIYFILSESIKSKHTFD